MRMGELCGVPILENWGPTRLGSWGLASSYLAKYMVYVMLAALLGPDGALYAYPYDVYLVSDPVHMVTALLAAPSMY